MQLPQSLRSYLAEPAVPDAPRRVWRDTALVLIASTAAVLEATFRTDSEWLDVSATWRWISVVVFFISVPPALWFRRSHPLATVLWGFGITLSFGGLVALAEGVFGGVASTGFMLICLYTLLRWDSGRNGAIGVGFAVLVGIIGNLLEPNNSAENWIGGFIVLMLPMQIGLAVRYQRNARHRAISEAKSLEREELARELHDTVAHHVSAIAVQAQAGRALAASDPERALAVLAVIEEAASRTLIDMRSMVGTLRNGAVADLAPQQGLDDLYRLGDDAPDRLHVSVSIADDLGPVGSAAQAALYRIARESITNAVRHARGATTVHVGLAPIGQRIRLTVSNDGQLVGRPSSDGYGLLGMAERAEMLGGTFSAQPQSGGGWQVVAELPRTGTQS